MVISKGLCELGAPIHPLASWNAVAQVRRAVLDWTRGGQAVMPCIWKEGGI